MLGARSPLADADPERLLALAENRLRPIAEAWRGEHAAILADLREAGGQEERGPNDDPVVIAIRIQLRRLEEEYLLRVLASEGFLPSYGFPLHVMPFVNTTIEEIKARRRERERGDGGDGSGIGREDGYGKYRAYPSRHLSVAIREYAPGSGVVIDGMVYESEGLTLHWHIPPGDQEIREEQIIQYAWRCRNCGSSGTLRRRSTECPECGRPLGTGLKQFLRPSGFAVDITAKPHNDVSRAGYVPVRDPWISAGRTSWHAMINPRIGRFRYHANGSVFHWSDGAAEFGLPTVRACGRRDGACRSDRSSAAGTLSASRWSIS
jgi:hypothetical protein